MIKKNQTRANLGVGFGIALMLLASMANGAATMNDVRVDAGGSAVTYSWPLVIAAVVLALIATALYLWGCFNYAIGKGYSPWVGLLGLASIFGLLILVLLKDRYKDGAPPELPPTNPPPDAYPPPPGGQSPA
jgi:hypothetical protein